MDDSTIKRLVEEELMRRELFTNYHGITSQNIRSHLVEPHLVWVDIEDSDDPPLEMWIVLCEFPAHKDGYFVGYDPQSSRWGVLERAGEDRYALVVSADTFAAALDGM